MTVYRATHRRPASLPCRAVAWLLSAAALPLLLVAVVRCAHNPVDAAGLWSGAVGLGLALGGWYLHPSTTSRKESR